MHTLDRHSRTIILSSSAVCLIGALAASPMTARSAGAATPPLAMQPRSGLVAPMPVIPPRAVRPQRDPFIGTRDEDVAAAMPARKFAAVPALPPIADLPRVPASLPPNAGAGEGTAVAYAPGTAPITAAVRAVIVGPHPYAIVDEGSTTRVVGVGGDIGGKRVLAITLSGVVLGDGERLSLSRGAIDATPSPSPPPGARPAPSDGASPAPAGSAPPTSAPVLQLQTLGPATYQPYSAIPSAAQAGVPLQPLPEQFGYGLPSYGQAGYRAPVPAPEPSPTGPTFGQKF